MGQVGALGVAAIVRLLDRVLLDQDPLIAAVTQGLDEFVGDVRVVGQGHLAGGEAADPLQGLPAEEGGEVVLPSTHVQPVILHRGGGGDGMAPGHAQPFHRPVEVRVAGDAFEGVEDVVPAHLAQAMKEGARVFQHDPRRLALGDELGDELAHALVAPGEDRGVVVVANALVFHHVLEVADDGGGAQVMAPRRDQGLVHVQGDGAGGAGLAKIDPAPVAKQGLGGTGGHDLDDLGLMARDIGDTFEIFGKRLHG